MSALAWELDIGSHRKWAAEELTLIAANVRPMTNGVTSVTFDGQKYGIMKLSRFLQIICIAYSDILHP